MFCRLPSKRKRKSDLEVDAYLDDFTDPFNQSNLQTLAAIGSDMANLLSQTPPAYQFPVTDNTMTDTRYSVKPYKRGGAEFLPPTQTLYDYI